MILPGDQATVKITVLKDMPLFEGQKFTLRENKQTIASGLITKICESIPTSAKAKLVKLKIPV